MNVWDVVILVVIAIAVAAAVRVLRKNRNFGCSGQCAGCTRHCASEPRKE